MTRRVRGPAALHTRSNITCSRSGTTNAAAQRMTHTYSITAASSVQGSGRLKKKRAQTCTMKTQNSVAKSATPTASAPLRSSRCIASARGVDAIEHAGRPHLGVVGRQVRLLHVLAESVDVGRGDGEPLLLEEVDELAFFL